MSSAEDESTCCSVCKSSLGEYVHCSICRSNDFLVCGECRAKELHELRAKIERASKMMPELQARCRAAYAAKKENHEAWSILSECEALNQRLEAVSRRVHSERLAIAKRRRDATEREIKLQCAEEAFVMQSAQLEAVGRAVLGNNQEDHGSSLFFVPLRGPNTKHTLPWQKVNDLFGLFPIKQLSAPERGSLRGIMTIVGLPLPNVGTNQVLTTSLPRNVCSSALAAVTQLTYSVAYVLGHSLPHPLAPRIGLDNAAAVYGSFTAKDTTPSRSKRSTAPRSRAGSLIGGIMAVTTGSRDERRRQLNSNTSSTGNSPARYVLAPPSPGESDELFAIALNLLQIDITHLCIKAGVDPARLWPAEAILLNLSELRDTAIRRRDTSSAENSQEHSPLSPAASVQTPDSLNTYMHSPGRSDLDDSDNDDWIFLGQNSISFIGLTPEDGSKPLPPLTSLPVLPGGAATSDTVRNTRHLSLGSDPAASS